MAPTPRDRLPDSTVALLRDGYEFIPKRAKRYDADVFRTRIMLRNTFCVTGVDAARIFYDADRFQRHGAAPGRLKKTLFGRGGVQALDGEEHRCRKHMFMALMTAEARADLRGRFERELHEAVSQWEDQDRVVLFHAVQPLLFRAVCGWSGVPIRDSEVKDRTQDMAAMIDSSGAVGPRHWRGRLARKRAEAWVSGLVEQVRAGELDAPRGRTLHTMATHTDPQGERLDARVAAVEVINILRPVVAISRYIVFLAHALHHHPKEAGGLREAPVDEPAIERFVQEVRRLYPFFTLVAAIAREDFDWQGHRFPEGARVLLDIYGTNRDPRVWDDPDTFWPDRFLDRDIDPFELIPQGGSNHELDHRCAGEWITIDLMKVALRFLVHEIRYDVPEQDLDIDLSRIPAIPESRMIIEKVRTVEAMA